MPSLNRRQVESLSLVARLLASENIRVQHSASAQTASFETKSRVLTLPVWKEMSGDLYDMLVAHEVAHALFTPKGDSWVKDLIDLVGEKNFNKLKMYVNVVEDARIERSMKDRYGGLRSVFARAYRDLTVKNPKLLALDQDLNDLPLIDRVNIHYKVGFAVDVPFSAEEMALVKRVAETKSWEEVVALAKELYDLSKKQKQDKKDKQQGEDSAPSGSKGEQGEGEEADGTPSDGEGEDEERGETEGEGENDDPADSTEGGEETEGDNSQDSDDAEAEEAEKSENNDKSKSNGASVKGDEKSKEDEGEKPEDAEADDSVTAKAMEQLSKENLENETARWSNSSNTVKMPVFNTDTGVEPFEKVIEDLKIMADKNGGHALYQKFLAKNKTAVAGLVQEFMRRKAADEAQRTRTADTGSIDPTRLWAYRVSDEIFGSYETKREGKNHGLLFLLDWSGSMNVILKETVEQLGMLVQFCAAANIPCEIYAFSNNHNILKDGEWSKEAGQVRPDAVRLLHLLSASARPAQLKTAIAGLLAWASKGSQGYGFFFGKNHAGEDLDSKYYLNGTPLNAALVAMNTMIPLFQKKTGVQVVNLCVLTDGDATDSIWYMHNADGGVQGLRQGDSASYNDKYQNVNIAGNRAVTRYEGREADLLRFLRAEHGVNVLGFRVGNSREIANSVKYAWNSVAKDSAEAKKMTKVGSETYTKEKTKFLRENDWVSGEEWYGYTEWFGVSNLKTDEEDYLVSVSSESTKAALAKALSAEIGKTKSSRPLMARIAQRVSVREK